MNHSKARGLRAIAAMFDLARQAGRPAFLPFFPMGYPSPEASLDAIRTLAAAGADGFEIGVPFSDPLADGPTIQAATQIALEKGMTVPKVLASIKTLRAEGLTQPILLFSYVNPLLAYGIDELIAAANAAGVDGLIIPDLPPEEADLFAGACDEHGMALVFFLAPTSSDERVRLVVNQARGFIYVLSLTGVTGARRDLPPDLSDFLGRVRVQAGSTPLVLGFGISQPEHVRSIAPHVDGFIVGSALVKAAAAGTDSLHELALRLRHATYEES
ncbi:MAG: tryptophan synthase subunit alpha [Chloroflexi bacterium]|nr:tryptophan synthase subunit alpha [Chloroflexota bacterium]